MPCPVGTDTQALVARALAEHIASAQALSAILPEIDSLIDLCATALERGNKLLLFGNGGSAAQASHIAAELVGRFGKERRALPAIALGMDPAVTTAIANDYGYSHLFRRQLEALARPGDVAIGLSTSGDSTNVLTALSWADTTVFGWPIEVEGGQIALPKNGRHSHAALITGARKPMRLYDASVLHIFVPSTDTARIQELHLLIGHMLCAGIEARLFG